MTIFVCDNTLEGVLTGIYDAWASKIKHEYLKIEVGPIGQQELFADYIYSKASSHKAEKVMTSIEKKISPFVYRKCIYCALSDRKDRADIIYRFLLLGFTVGRKITEHLKEPYVMNLFEVSRKVGNEIHYYHEFLRFHRLNQGIYLSHISPKSDVLWYVGEHFADRMPSEYFMIVDDTRKKALVHPKERQYYFRDLTDQEFEILVEFEKEKDRYTNLWKTFFETIAIKERTNPICQRNHLPLHYRENLVEFMD